MRLFVAAELPDAAVDALVAWTPRDEGLRAVRRESMHVTLAFLGERAEDVVPVVGEVVDRVARPAGELRLGPARWLPRRRPRVLAVELCDDGLTELQAELSAALAERIGFEPEHRRFLAHVTVARTRDGKVRGELPPVPDVGPFHATALTLFRSRLSPKGASYEALRRVSLADP